MKPLGHFGSQFRSFRCTVPAPAVTYAAALAVTYTALSFVRFDARSSCRADGARRFVKDKTLSAMSSLSPRRMPHALRPITVTPKARVLAQ